MNGVTNEKPNFNLRGLQSNRMFFWWELCKLPLEHWYFGWQFESSKLQPAWASCSIHLVPRGQNSLKFSKLFHMLLQYFEDGYVSFCVDEPLNNYQDLLDRVKKAELFYKDLSLQAFTGIDVDRNFSLHVSEAFKNTLPCGSDIYQQVYLR